MVVASLHGETLVQAADQADGGPVSLWIGFDMVFVLDPGRLAVTDHVPQSRR